MNVVGYAIGLALIWVLAWGSPSPANVLGGLAVAAVLLTVAPDIRPARSRVRVRPVAIARFAGYLLWEVLRANVALSREIVRRHSRIRTGVIGVPLPACSDGMVTLVTNVLALTPGTMPIEVVRDPTVIYVHILQLGDVEEARRDIQHLADLAFTAFAPHSAPPTEEVAP